MAHLPTHIIAQVALLAQPMLCGKPESQGYRWASEQRVAFNGTDSPGTENKEITL